MNDQDYIRKAVELADNFSIDGWWNYRIQEPNQYPRHAPRKSDIPNWFLDALAAQLVRQVDDTERYLVVEYKTATEICAVSDGMLVWRREHKGRTMNTIIVIVDSKVLE